VDQELKERMKELGEAINQSLSDSALISAAVSRIKEDGYDPFLVLEATIGVGKRGEQISDKPSAVSTVSMGTSESARWIGEIVRVGTTKPGGCSAQVLLGRGVFGRDDLYFLSDWVNYLHASRRHNAVPARLALLSGHI
jgi:hypothetical protein